MDAAALDALLGGTATEREESWRYSRNALRALTQQEFAAADPAAELAPELIAQFDWPQTRGARVVFVNGICAPRYSDRIVETVLDERGARHVLELEDDTRPLHLVYVNTPGPRPSRWQSAGEIRLPRGRGTVVEQHVGAPGADVFGALDTLFLVDAGADLRLTTLTDLPDSVALLRRQRARVQGQWRTTHALFGGRLQRFDLACDLAAPHARTEQRGVLAPRARQHIDVHLDVRHAARDTASDVLWRGVADERGRGILRGAITVAAGADGADAQLQTKNLLLSAHAEIDAQPVLEIQADEVKASHGATVGQLDERGLFYLRSRGVPIAAARAMLIAGFCREALQSLSELDIAEHVDAALAARLPRTEGAPV